MNIQPDFEELLRLFGENEVDYMIVGGYAVAFHGYPRFTKDLDIFFDSSPANILRLRRALVDFGFEEQDLPEDVFSTPGNVIVFGVPPVRVDLVSRIDGVTFGDARPNVVRGKYGCAAACFIGRADLLKNKRSTKRSSDKVDADKLD